MRATGEGLNTTFEVLSTTENEAAVRVLVAALDSPHAQVRDGALDALLTRRNPAGHRELVRRLHTFDRQWMDRLREHAGRLGHALREAIVDSDPQAFSNGCRAAVWLGQYDLIPTLVGALEATSSPDTALASSTLLELVEQLVQELAAPGDPGRRDPRLARDHVLTALESSLERFPKHRRREIVEAFLLLAPRENAVLKQVLQNPHHSAFLAVMDVLSKGRSPGIVGLLLSCLDDPQAPSAAISVIAKRSDPKFIRYLLRRIGRRDTPALAQNLKRIRTVGWLQSGPGALDGLDELAQQGAVRLAVASGIPRTAAFAVIEHLLLRGKPEGRRAAAAALADFQGAAANALAVRALDDPDPQVQAAIAGQLRQRGVRGILPRLVHMLESPHAAVRQAVREALSEFNFKRFLGAFDMLDDDVRRTTGALVRKIDPHTLPQLRAELESPARTRRLRGLAVARAIGAVGPLEPEVIAMLSDADHLVRAEAAAALAQSGTEAARRALRRAEGDRSPTVQQAASAGLHRHDDFAVYREALADPRD